MGAVTPKFVCVLWEKPRIELWAGDPQQQEFILARGKTKRGGPKDARYHYSFISALKSALGKAHVAALHDSEDIHTLNDVMHLY